MEFSEYQFHAREAGARLFVHGDTAARISYGHAAVIVEDDGDIRSVAGNRFIDRVVNDFPQTVHQSAGVSRTDVHTRPLADSLKAFQHGEVASGVISRGHEKSL